MFSIVESFKSRLGEIAVKDLMPGDLVLYKRRDKLDIDVSKAWKVIYSYEGYSLIVENGWGGGWITGNDAFETTYHFVLLSECADITQEDLADIERFARDCPDIMESCFPHWNEDKKENKCSQ